MGEERESRSRRHGDFYWLGVRAGVQKAHRSGKRFHELLSHMHAVDAGLTAFVWTVYLGLGLSLLLVAVTRSPVWIFALVIFSAALVFVGALKSMETRERNANRLTPISLFHMDVGSAKVLRGDILIWHLFVNTRRRRWNRQAAEKTLARARTATGWLTARAQEADVPIGFEHRSLPGEQLALGGSLPCAANRYRHLDRLRGAVREASGFALAEERRRSGACLLVHVAASIRSYAVPAIADGDGEEEGLEFGVLGAGAKPAEIAHELLHLFGAEDQYLPGTSGTSPERLADGSVMFAAGRLPLERSRVDESTARSIGWS